MEIVAPLFYALIAGAIVIPLSTRSLPPAQRSRVRSILVIAFALRVAVSTTFAVIRSARVFHEDAEGYEYLSMRIAQYWMGEGSPVLDWEISERNYGLIYLFARLLYLTGRYPLTLTIFNSLIGTMNALLVYLIGLRLLHERVAQRAMLFVAFFPSMIIWSSIALKDPLMSFCICLTLLSAISLRDHFSLASLAGCIWPMFIVYPIRFYLVYFMAVSIVGTIAFGSRRSLVTGVGKQLVLVGLLFAVVAAVGFSKNASSDMEFFDLERVSSYRRGMAVTAKSSFAADVDVSTPGKALAFLPIGLSTLIWGPFPWQMTSLRPLLTLPEMLYWWYLAPSLLSGFWFAARRQFRQFAPLIVFASTMLIGYALTLGNIGAAFRMRAQVFNFLFLFVALGQFLKLAHARGIDPHALINEQFAQPPLP